MFGRDFFSGLTLDWLLCEGTLVRVLRKTVVNFKIFFVDI
jgi:hypothetical protein